MTVLVKILMFYIKIILISASEVQVVIVGAGASGIAAASWLMEHGVDNIVILEAEDRIGGRINTIPFGMLIFYYYIECATTSLLSTL
jgi:cation diffusion facilitator CzcD-associated flavoprotein CzcO